MKYYLSAALAAVLAAAGFLWVRANRPLAVPDLMPGPWYFRYLADWPEAHPGADVTSAIGQDSQGRVWVTDTPEWDRDWFYRRGFEFPARWLPFSQ